MVTNTKFEYSHKINEQLLKRFLLFVVGITEREAKNIASQRALRELCNIKTEIRAVNNFNEPIFADKIEK